MADAPNSYKDQFWSDLSASTEKKLGIPSGLLSAIVTRGERSNADQVSEAGAKTPFQIIPSTRKAIIDKYGVDAYLSPENAAEAAGLLLKESLQRNKGDAASAVAEYHGGTDRANWGPRTRAYVQRVVGEQVPVSQSATAADQSTFDRVMAQRKQETGNNSIALIYDAYKSGKMTPEEASEFEADVKSGLVMLPRGATLAGQKSTSPTEIPEPIMLDKGIADAYRQGKLSDKERAELEADMKSGLVKLPVSIVDLVPTGIPGAVTPTEQGVIVRPKEPTLGERLIGANEAALTMATGMTSGLVGMVGGTVEGITQSILDGTYGTREAADRTEQLAMQRAGQLTFQPRTAQGAEQAQTIGKAMGDVFNPLGPLGGEMAALGAGMKAATPAVAARTAAGVERVAQGAAKGATAVTDAIKPRVAGAVESIRSAPQRVGEMIGISEPLPTPTAGASVGAAGVEMPTLRETKSASLPVPIELTKGAATRDAAQLAFEKEQLRNPELGAPLRQRAEENNLQTLQNIDALFDMTEAEARDAFSTGSKVIKALSEGKDQARNKVNVLYRKAEKSQEAQAIADVNQPVKIGEGENAITGSLIDYVNNRVAGVEPKVAEAAKKQLIRFGIAEEGTDGQLIGKPATVKQLEDFRSEMSGAADLGVPRQLRDESIIKRIVDATTEPVSGPLFKEARAARTEMGRKYENRAVVARLIQNVKGMDDPRVPADMVFNKSILNASPEEITFFKRVLNTSGEDGRQAWKELQGALVRHIEEESTKGMGMDSMDRPIISPAQLNKTIQKLDGNGRLDIVLGKQKANIVRDLNDVVKYVNTVPPGTLINNSGTAMSLMAAIAEAGTTGVLTGLPVPVMSTIKMLSKHINNKRVSAKIKDALNVKSNKF